MAKNSKQEEHFVGICTAASATWRGQEQLSRRTFWGYLYSHFCYATWLRTRNVAHCGGTYCCRSSCAGGTSRAERAVVASRQRSASQARLVWLAAARWCAIHQDEARPLPRHAPAMVLHTHHAIHRHTPWSRKKGTDFLLCASFLVLGTETSEFFHIH